MSIAKGPITGQAHEPSMQLEYGVQLKRLAPTFSAIGSITSNFVVIPTVYPADVAPMSDELVMGQLGQTDMLTHVIHFQAGTDVRNRDEATIIYAPRPGSFGNVGDVYTIVAVLEPSEDMAYIRCRAYKGKAVTG